MAEYNPDAPDIIGQQWVPIRTEELRFLTSSNPYERGYTTPILATQATGTPINLTHAAFFIDRPSEDVAVLNKVHTVNLYPAGRELETGPIKRLLIEPTYEKFCQQGVGIGLACTDINSGGASNDYNAPAAVYNGGDELGWAVGNAAWNQVDWGFAVRKYRDKLLGKRILNINVVMTTSLTWVTPDGSAPAITGGAQIADYYSFYLSAAYGADTNQIPTNLANSGQTIAQIANSTTATYFHKLQRFTMGNVNTFYTTSAPPISTGPFNLKEWQSDQLERFDANNGGDLRIRITSGNNAYAPPFASYLNMEYVRLEVLYCDETRIATGSRVQTHTFTYGGPNAVHLMPIFGNNTDAITVRPGMQLTVTLTNGAYSAYTPLPSLTPVGYMASPQIVGDAFLNQVRQLEQLNNTVQGIELDFPQPMDNTAEGLYPTSQATNLIPQIVLYHDGNTALNSYDMGTAMQDSHAYGRNVAASVSPLEVLQGIYNPLGSYITGTQLKYARFYARHVTPTADPNSNLRITTRLSLPDIANSLYTNNFENGSLNGWTANAGASIALSTDIAHTGIYSAKVTASGSNVTSPHITVIPGQQYYLSCWLFTTSLGQQVFPYIQWFDANNNVISNNQAAQTGLAQWGWSPRVVLARAPENAASATLNLQLAFGFPAVYMDDIQFNIVRVVEDTFDRPRWSTVVDNFHRTSTPGWGNPEIGTPAWTSITGSAAASSVSIPANSQAQIDTSTAVNNTWIVYTGTGPFVSGSDGNQTITVRLGSPAVTGEYGIVARMTDANNYYSFRVVRSATQAVLSLKRMLTGTETTLASFTYAYTFNETSTTDWILKFDINDIILRGWLIDVQQPGTAWASVIATDSSFGVGSFQGVIAKNVVSNGIIKFWNYDAARMYSSWNGPTSPSGHFWDLAQYPQIASIIWLGDRAPGTDAYIQEYTYSNSNAPVGKRNLHAEIVTNSAAPATTFGPTIWMQWGNFDARVEVRPTLAPTGGNSFAGMVFRTIGNSGTFYLRVNLVFQSSPANTAFLQLQWFNNSVLTTLATSNTFNVNLINPVMVRVHLEGEVIMAKAVLDPTQEPPVWDIIFNLNGNVPSMDFSKGFIAGCVSGTLSGNTNPTPLVFEFYRFLAYAVDSYSNYPSNTIVVQPGASPYTFMDSAGTATGTLNVNDLNSISPVVDNWREVTLELDKPFTLGDQGALTFVSVSTDGMDARWEVLAATSMALSAFVNNAGIGNAASAGLTTYVQAPKQYQPGPAGYASISPLEGAASAIASRDQKVSLNDTFFRTVAPGGWGTANTGQSWQVTAGTPSNFQTSFNGFASGPTTQWFAFNNAAYVHCPAGTLQTIGLSQVDGDTIWPSSEGMFQMLLGTPVGTFGDIVRLIISWPAPLNIGQVSLTVEFRSDGNAYAGFSTAAGQSQNLVQVPFAAAPVSGYDIIQFYTFVNSQMAGVSVKNDSTSLLISDVDQRLWFAPTSVPVSGNGSLSVTLDLTNATQNYDIGFGGFRFGRTVYLANNQGYYDQIRKNNYAAMSWAPQRGPTVNVPLSQGNTTNAYSSSLYEDKSTAMSIYFAPKPPAPTGISVVQNIQALAPVNTCVPMTAFTAPTQLAYNTLSWPTNTTCVLDSFNRTVSGGWGQPTGYNAWTPIGPPGYSWTDGSGTAYITTPGATIGTPQLVGQTIELDSWNCDIRFTLDMSAGSDVNVQGNGAYCRIGFVLRDYEILYIYPQWNSYNNTWYLQLQNNGYALDGREYPLWQQDHPWGGPQFYGAPGNYSSFASTVPLMDAGWLDSPIPCPMNVRLQLHNTELRIKLWAVNQPEPANWFQGLIFTANLAGPQLRSRFSITLDTKSPVLTNPYHYTVTAKISNLSITNGKNIRREIQRQDTVDPVWRTIYASANPFNTTFNDYEARIGVATSYRVRDVGYGEFPGSYSTTLVTTLAAPGVSGITGGGHVLAFTTNTLQDGSGNLVYNNSWEGGAPAESFSFPEAGFTQMQLMYGKDFYTAFHPTERGGESFTRDLVIQGAAVSPKVIQNMQSLRDLAWNNLPYLCVRTEDGDRWFANVQVPSGNVRFRRTLYQVSITVTELTITPYPIDPLTPWGSSFAALQ